MLNASQSLLHPDQYRFGIKSTVLLYSLSISQSHKLYDSDHNSTTYNDFDENIKVYLWKFDSKLYHIMYEHVYQQ